MIRSWPMRAAAWLPSSLPNLLPDNDDSFLLENCYA
jgi:hypothetical protein